VAQEVKLKARKSFVYQHNVLVNKLQTKLRFYCLEWPKSTSHFLSFRVTEFCSDKQILSIRVTEVHPDNATHVWLKTSLSMWLRF